MSMSIRILTVLALVGGLALTACKKEDSASTTSGTSTPPATTDQGTGTSGGTSGTTSN